MIETELVIARMQNRRGRRADLPQPLMPGELGFCTDTGQLFIGAELSTNMTPGIEVFTHNIDASDLANNICSYNIIQISHPGLPPLTDVELGFVPDWQEETENNSYYGWNVSSDVPDPTTIVLPAGYTARMFTDPTLTPTNTFIKGDLIMPTYMQSDAGAVASIINAIQYWSLTTGANPPEDPYTYTGITGLVTTKQNIEIYTEYSPGRGLPIKRILDPQAVWTEVPGIDFTYSDALDVDYSLQCIEYSRVGELRIICSPDNGTDPVVGMLSDTYTELFNDGNTATTVDFKMAPPSGTNPSGNVTALYYKTSGIATPITLTTSTKIWQSF